jgi:ribose 5-phosphate isomerase B
MKIVIGSDHRGFHVKQRIVGLLRTLSHEVRDLGVVSGDISVDYPDFAFDVARLVGTGEAERGVLICGTGIGMCIAANKVTGVRAACVHDIITAEMSRRHNDANVLCMSADMLGEELIDRIVRVWLTTDFDAGRHQRRVEKIVQFETNQKNL